MFLYIPNYNTSIFQTYISGPREMRGGGRGGAEWVNVVNVRREGGENYLSPLCLGNYAIKYLEQSMLSLHFWVLLFFMKHDIHVIYDVLELNLIISTLVMNK